MVNDSTKLWRALLGAGLIGVLTIPTTAQGAQVDLTKKSMQDLMNIEVTSVSKQQERLLQIASAVFVITREDKNLLKDHHEEFVEPTGSAGTTLTKRGAYGE